MSQIWDKRAKESGPAFAAFQAYREMGPQRSTAKVAQSFSKSKRLIDRWSGTHDWVARASAWDKHLDQKGQKAEERAVAAMRTRHIKIAERLQDAGSAELEKLAKAIADAPETAKMTVEQVLRMLREGTLMERLNRDLPGEVVEVKADYSKLDVEELVTLRRLLAKSREES